MNIIMFMDAFRGIPVFSIREIAKLFPDFDQDNLVYWQKKGYLVRIRNGWYSLKGSIEDLPDAYFVANKIYSPSYIALESALSFYGWIPEGVFTTTSISTQKTNVFDTPVGRFRYANIKPSLFFGYKLLQVNGCGVKVADPEKALLDFIYFHPKIADPIEFEGFRFNLAQMQMDLDFDKLHQYETIFNSKVVSERLNKIINFFEYA